jgi:hypothetical protein
MHPDLTQPFTIFPVGPDRSRIGEEVKVLPQGDGAFKLSSPYIYGVRYGIHEVVATIWSSVRARVRIEVKPKFKLWVRQGAKVFPLDLTRLS